MKHIILLGLVYAVSFYNLYLTIFHLRRAKDYAKQGDDLVRKIKRKYFKKSWLTIVKDNINVSKK